MEDPLPENIEGSVVRTHKFSHTIRWDYLAIAAIAGYVLVKLSGWLGSSVDRDGQDQLEDAEFVPARETTKVAGFADGGD
jgi:hypothetical protein